jgi:uridine phosphorylase
LLVVVTGLRSEAKILRGQGVACISVGGKANTAPGKIERAIAQGATGLVSFGIAGALHPDLRTGDMVVGQTVVDETGANAPAHSEWVRTIMQSTQTVTPALSRGPSEGQARAEKWIPAQGRDDGMRSGVQHAPRPAVTPAPARCAAGG